MSDFETNDAPSVHNEANDALDRRRRTATLTAPDRTGGDTEQGER